MKKMGITRPRPDGGPNKKSPRGIIPRRCYPSPRGAKYITVTQDTSPSGLADVCD